MKKTLIAETLMVLFGVFLIIDSFFLHLIRFDYVKLGISWLDSIFNHWIIGVILVIVGLCLFKLDRRRR